MPHTGIQHRWIARLHGELTAASLLVGVQHLLPGLAAIDGLVHAPFFIRTEQMPHHCHPDNIRILRMNYDAYDMPAVVEAYVLPAMAAIIAAPHTMQPFRYIAAQGTLPFSYVKHSFIAGCHRHRAYAAAKILIADVLPVAAAIGGFPYAAAGSTEVEYILIFITTGHCPTAPTPERTYQPVAGSSEVNRVAVRKRIIGTGRLLLRKRGGAA